MKKNLFYLACATAILSACTLELIDPQDTQNTVTPDGKKLVTIYASLADETKTTVNETGIYSWQASEKISLVEQDYNASGGIDFSLENATTGAFSGTLTATKDPVFAVSPKGALGYALESSNDVLYDITLPDSYSNYVPGTTNSIMIGNPDGQEGDNYKFEFYSAAALLKFSYANVPVGTKKFVFSNTHNYVTGTWSDLDTTTGVTLSENDTNFSEDGATVTLDLATKVYEANTTLDFYIPVPASTYQNFAIQLQDKDGNLISGTSKSKDGLSIPLAAGDIFPCPTVNLAAATKGAIWNPTLTAAANLSTSGATLGGLNVTSSVSAGSFESSGSARGCAFSSGADPTITIPYTGHVESVVVVCSANNALSTVAVTVDDIALGSTQDISNGVANETHTFKVATNGRFRKGTVKVIITNDKSDKSTWIKSITINGDVREEAGLSYAVTAVAKATDAANFTNPLTNPNSLEGITYESSDTDVATVNSTTGEVTMVAAGETTITASYAGGDYYKAGNASYTLTVADAYLNLPLATTPAKADCAENSYITFDVSSNIEWTASKGTDANNIIKSVSQEGNTVTVTFNANDGAEKTAQVTITPVVVGYRAALTKNMTVTQKKYEKVDALVYSDTGFAVEAGSYLDWASDVDGTVSDAVYAGNSCKNANNYLQLRATDAGIVTKTSGGSITKVAVTYAGSNSNGRKLSVYGKNTAYSGVSDLYNDSTKGTLIGTITFTTGDATGYLEIASYYEYIGLWSGDGAMYFSEIDFHWDNAKPDPGIMWKKSGVESASDVATLATGDDTMPTIAIYNPNSLTISYSSSDASVATINSSTGAIALVGGGSTDITATFAGDATYKPVAKKYTLTVTDSRSTCVTPSFSPGAGAVDANDVVTISSSTTGSTIYYTVDGTDPNTGSAHGTVGAATASVTIDVAKTIKAIAVKDDWKNSDIASAVYSISGSATPLSNPSSVSITAISATGFTATWTNDTNATGYSWMLSTASTAPASTSDASVKAYGAFTSASPSGGASISSSTWTLTKTSLSLSGKYYLYVKAVGDGSSYSDSGYSSDSIITLKFDLTSNPGAGGDAWPSAYSTTLTDYTYSLNDVDYTFKLYNAKCNDGYLILKYTAGLGLPAISGYKLTKVVANNSSGCSKSTNVGISSTAPTTATYISGGSQKTWSTQGSTYTYSLSSTSNNTVYYMYITTANAQITYLELTYE